MWAQGEKRLEYSSLDMKLPKRMRLSRTGDAIPSDGMRFGIGGEQLRLTLNVSPTGEVMDAEAVGEDNALKLWPQVNEEVRGWKFTPFEEDGKAVTAEVEEYIDLVPPERLPTHHVIPPVLGPESKVTITLQRGDALGVVLRTR